MMKSLVLLCLIVGLFCFLRSLNRKKDNSIGYTENYPILSRVKGSRPLPNFLHYIHRGHRHRKPVVNRADRRAYLRVFG